MTWLRWTFEDPSAAEFYTVPLNPNEMTPPHPERAITSEGTTAVGGTVLVWEGNTPAFTWTFSGRILYKDHYDQLKYWSEKQVRIFVTDHFGRRFTVVPKSFQPKVKRARKWNWSHDYSWSCLVVAGPTAATVMDEAL